MSFKERILARNYSSPSTARAGVKRSALGTRERNALFALIDAWENEETLESPVVGGVPAAEQASEVVDKPLRLLPSGRELSQPVTIHLNSRVRARLTPYGISLLYAARERVAPFPSDILERRGVWETELWEFMSVMGGGLSSGETPTVGYSLDVLRLGS